MRVHIDSRERCAPTWPLIPAQRPGGWVRWARGEHSARPPAKSLEPHTASPTLVAGGSAPICQDLRASHNNLGDRFVSCARPPPCLLRALTCGHAAHHEVLQRTKRESGEAGRGAWRAGGQPRLCAPRSTEAASSPAPNTYHHEILVHLLLRHLDRLCEGVRGL